MKLNNDIKEELKMLNSTLRNVSKSMPYDFPQNYFDELHSRVSLQTKTKQSAQGVPEGYFEQLPENVFEKIQQELKEEQNKPRLIDISWWKISATAAVIAILISIGIYQTPSDLPLTTVENLAEISDEQILAYVEDNIDEFDIDLINSSLSITDEETTFKDIDNTAIDDYLYNID